MDELLLINGYVFLTPEFTPGLERRVTSAFNIAWIKDTRGEVPYDVWRKAGLINGANCTDEFVKALKLRPSPLAKDPIPPLETCLEKASEQELDAIWNWYAEKKIPKMPSATESANDTSLSAPVENPTP